MDIVTLGSPDNKTKIYVQKLSLKDLPSETIASIKDYNKLYAENKTDYKFLTDNEINITGSQNSYLCIYTSTDPWTNELRKGVEIFFGNENDTLYIMEIWGPKESFNKTQTLYEQIIPTIKI